MKKRRLISVFISGVALAFFLGGEVAHGQLIVRDYKLSDPTKPTSIWLPYAFHTETFGLSLGVGAVVSGHWQEQLTAYATAFVSRNGSYRIWAGAFDMTVPGTDRLFLSPEGSMTQYAKVRAYISGNPEFIGQQAGTNDSDPENFVMESAGDVSASLQFRYVLPIGHAQEHIVNRVFVDRGMLHSDPVGGDSWNPMRSGRTYILVEPFFSDQRIDLESGVRSLRSNGLRFELRHDNTDFVLNPSRGSVQRIALIRDFGWFKSDNDWTRWELEFRKFFSLGKNEFARQQVLAFKAWFTDVPTWEVEHGPDGSIRINHRPPYYDEPSLGGIERMRAFPENRFNDRSAVYYGIEYRLIPHWNPLEKLSFAGLKGVDWLQWVVFVEAGRVAGDFDLGELHSAMRFDAGLGVRAFSKGILGRLDFAFSDEGWSARAMMGQAF